MAKDNRDFVLLVVVVAFSVTLFLGLNLFQYNNPPYSAEVMNQNSPGAAAPMPGSDRDAHGCRLSPGNQAAGLPCPAPPPFFLSRYHAAAAITITTTRRTNSAPDANKAARGASQDGSSNPPPDGCALPDGCGCADAFDVCCVPFC